MQEHDERTAKKQHLHIRRCLKNGMDMGAGTIFEHDHYSMGKIPCKSQCCASLRNLCANLVPKGKWMENNGKTY